jgi:hypothetical protein
MRNGLIHEKEVQAEKFLVPSKEPGPGTFSALVSNVGRGDILYEYFLKSKFGTCVINQN